VPQLQQISFHSWQQLAAQQAAPSSSRRGLFRSLLRPPSTQPATTQPVLMTSARAPLLQLLREQGAGSVLWTVELDPKRCTWCLACTQLCDSGALQFIVDTLPPAAPDRTRPLPRSVRNAPGRFTLDMQRCTGCGVCVDACDQLALRNSAAPDPQPSASTHIALDLAHCAQCGVGFHHPRRAPVPAVHPLDAAAAPQVAQICPACRQGRPRQHDRWVQTGEGT
jgi:ferredoxin